MAEHCENCNCENRRKYCGLFKETYFKILLIVSVIFFIGMSTIALKQIMRECTSKWTDIHFAAFALLYSGFLLIYMMVINLAIEPLENMMIFIPWLYRYMRGLMSNICNRLRLLTWSDIRLMFSVRRAIARTHPQQQISITDNESNEDRPPPLPPRNTKMLEAARTTMFQRLTSTVSQGATSSTAPEDESSDLKSGISPLPHCSKQLALPVKSYGRRRKKFLKREHFKDMMSTVTNLNVIHEEGLDTQAASELKIPFSAFTQITVSDSETEQQIETSFTTKPHQPGSEEQDFSHINVDENDDPTTTRRVHDIQAQAQTSSTGDIQKDPGGISGNSSKTTKKQLSTFQDFFTQRRLKLWNPKRSEKKRGLINAPISEFESRFKFKDVPLSTLGNPTQEQTLADVNSGSQGGVKESGIQFQSSTSYIRLPASESQYWAFDMRATEGNEKSLHQPTASAEIKDSMLQTQEQSSAVAFSGSQEQSRLPDMQTRQGNRDQTAANYIKLRQLEELLKVSDIRTEMKQSSREHSAIRDVQTSLQDQISSMPGIQRMSTYQEQDSSAGPQKQDRTSDVQRRRSSRKHNPIPSYKKSSESESESEEERLNLRQPMQTCAEFPLAKRQLQSSGIGKVHEYFTQEIEMQEKTLQEETSASRTSRTSKTLEKLRDLQQASEAGFPEAKSQVRDIEGELPPSAGYAGKRFRAKAERSSIQKRWESLSIGSERPFREWNIRTKRTQGSTVSTSQLSACTKELMENSSIPIQQIEASEESYLPHSALSRSEVTPTPKHVVTTPLEKTRKGEDQITQRISRYSSHLKKMDEQHTQRKEAFLTHGMAGGGLVLIKDGVEYETEAHSSEQSFRYDQPMMVLDLSHIEVPLPPKDINPSIDKDESQISEKPIRQSSTITERIEGSAESTSQLFACARGGMVTSSIQRQKIGASTGCYLPHSTLSTSEGTPAQKHVAITPLNKGKEREDRIGQRSSTDSSHVKERDKEETQRTESFSTFDMETKGLASSEDPPKDGTEADSSQQSFVYDRSMNVLDLSHIEVSLPTKDIKPSKDKGESQNSERLIRQSNTRTKGIEESAESTSQLSVCVRGEPESFNIRSQETEESEEGYLPHSSLSISEDSSTQAPMTTTPLSGKWSSIDPLHLKESDKQETQREEKFLTLDMATGGVVLSKDGAEDGTEADSSQPSFMYGQPFDVLDLSHIEVPFPPLEDKASEDKDEHEN